MVYWFFFPINGFPFLVEWIGYKNGKEWNLTNIIDWSMYICFFWYWRSLSHYKSELCRICTHLLLQSAPHTSMAKNVRMLVVTRKLKNDTKSKMVVTLWDMLMWEGLQFINSNVVPFPSEFIMSQIYIQYHCYIIVRLSYITWYNYLCFLLFSLC